MRSSAAIVDRPIVTGTSTGFGYQLVKHCLAQGDKVAATARNSSKLDFGDSSKKDLLCLDCDVTDEKSDEVLRRSQLITDID